MKKQIVQILHNLIVKGIKSDGRSNANRHVLHGASASKSLKSGSSPQGKSVVQWVGRKNFEKIVDDSLRKEQGQGCLLIGDVDRCRDINNIYGRDTGDAVVQYAASVLYDIFGEHVCIGNQDHDVFELWMPAMSGVDTDAIRKMTGMVNGRLLHPPKEIPPSSISVGVSFCEPDDDCRSLVKKANKALYIVKESGRCGCEFML